jgi:hypothetical protein
MLTEFSCARRRVSGKGTAQDAPDAYRDRGVQLVTKNMR